MYGRDKFSPLHLPLRVIIVLVICACSVAVHFVAEGLAPVAGGAPGFDLAEQGGHTHLDYEHCEDNFISPFLTCLPVEHTVARLPSAVATCAFSLSISLLLPPPNS